MNESDRGSEKLIAELFGSGEAVSQEAVAKAFGIQLDKAELLAWWIRGQPRPDWFFGKFKVPIDQVGPAVGSIISRGFVLEGFPLGKPRPDSVLLNVTSQPRGF
jgi:hypothetical protein